MDKNTYSKCLATELNKMGYYVSGEYNEKYDKPEITLIQFVDVDNGGVVLDFKKVMGMYKRGLSLKDGVVPEEAEALINTAKKHEPDTDFCLTLLSSKAEKSYSVIRQGIVCCRTQYYIKARDFDMTEMDRVMKIVKGMRLAPKG